MATLEIIKNKLAEMHQAEEYFNALSTNIQLSGSDIKVVAVSSVQPNDCLLYTSSIMAYFPSITV